MRPLNLKVKHPGSENKNPGRVRRGITVRRPGNSHRVVLPTVSCVNSVGLRGKRSAFPPELPPSPAVWTVESPAGVPEHRAGATPSSDAVLGPPQKDTFAAKI